MNSDFRYKDDNPKFKTKVYINIIVKQEEKMKWYLNRLIKHYKPDKYNIQQVL